MPAETRSDLIIHLKTNQLSTIKIIVFFYFHEFLILTHNYYHLKVVGVSRILFKEILVISSYTRRASGQKENNQIISTINNDHTPGKIFGFKRFI